MRSRVCFLTRSIALMFLAVVAMPLVYGQLPAWMPDPTQQQTYTLHRSSSREETGGNADYRAVTPGQTLTLMDVDGPGMISHLWFTLADGEQHHHFDRLVVQRFALYRRLEFHQNQ